MTTRQRHTPPEIATKLAMADDMAAQGRLHGDIARSLGISVMTYHRWRKARRLVHPISNPAPDTVAQGELPDRDRMNQIRDLWQENQRLRRLVTDLLLEKDKLEEGLRSGAGNRRVVHS